MDTRLIYYLPIAMNSLYECCVIILEFNDLELMSCSWMMNTSK